VVEETPRALSAPELAAGSELAAGPEMEAALINPAEVSLVRAAR
jgi:hypothetical protein